MTALVRPLTAADADIVQEMVLEFGDYLTGLGDAWRHNFTKERYLADGFGHADGLGLGPAFRGFIAENADGVLGYLLMAPNYDVDQGKRIEIVIDLWVRASARRAGAGRALMDAAAAAAKQGGARQLLWAVYKPNKLAVDFYRRIGGEIIEDLDWMTLNLD